MKSVVAVICMATVLIVAAGCTTRSISNSGYGADQSRYGARNGYTGELSEFDILGIDRGANPTDEEISRTLAARQLMSLKKGSSVLLIQSGAAFPDEPMARALERHFTVGLFSGIPLNTVATAPGAPTAESYSRSLRLAAARGGHEKIIVYWGVLESARENLATASVSWVPVVGWLLPDERQQMRIRLKVALVDVRTGQWDMFSTAPVDDKSLSTILGRAGTDQTLVSQLKERAYVAAADDVVKRYVR